LKQEHTGQLCAGGRRFVQTIYVICYLHDVCSLPRQILEYYQNQDMNAFFHTFSSHCLLTTLSFDAI